MASSLVCSGFPVRGCAITDAEEDTLGSGRPGRGRRGHYALSELCATIGVHVSGGERRSGMTKSPRPGGPDSFASGCSPKEGCEMRPVCQSCMKILPPFAWTAATTCAPWIPKVPPCALGNVCRPPNSAQGSLSEQAFVRYLL